MLGTYTDSVPLGMTSSRPALETALATDRRDGSSSGFRVEIVHPTAAA
jgi:hypothetical protein